MAIEPHSDRKRKADPSVDPVHAEGADLLNPQEPREAGEEDALATPGRRRVATGGDTDAPPTLLERLESVFRMASLVAISASVVLATFQFYQGRIDRQKERSVELMNTWQNSGERKAYARLRGALEKRLVAMESMQASAGAVSALKTEIGAIAIKGWAEKPDSYPMWSEDIDSVFTFYGEVEFCIRAGLCDEPLLTAYFGREARSFWEYFKAYAEQRQASHYPGYGQPLEELVEILEDSP